MTDIGTLRTGLGIGMMLSGEGKKEEEGEAGSGGIKRNQ